MTGKHRDLEAAVKDSKRERAWMSAQFATGLVHELTNQITACLTLLDAIAKSAPPGDASETTSQLERSLRGCARLLVQSQRLIENSPSLTRPDLNAAVEIAVRLLRHVVNQNIQVEVRLDPTVDGLRVNSTGLEEILAILLVRAREALSREGAVLIETGFAQLDAPRPTRLSKIEPGDYATVAITCTNERGADQEWERWLAGLVEGQDTPSPLLIEQWIRQLDAAVEVAQRPYYGETLTIYLPVAAIRTPVKQDEVEAGKWHIAVVEDDQVLREGIRAALERRGFRITAFGSAEQAIERFADARDVDLLVTDIVMGRMNGWDLSKRLLTTHPEMFVVFTSGYASVPGFDPTHLPSNCSFLPKPFEVGQLLDHIRGHVPNDEVIC